MVNKIKLIHKIFIYFPITFVFALLISIIIFVIIRKNYSGSEIWKIQEEFLVDMN